LVRGYFIEGVAAERAIAKRSMRGGIRKSKTCFKGYDA